MLAELGPLALAVLAATLALPFVATRRSKGAETLAATAGYTTFLLHAAVDWDWEQPAVTLAGLFCAAALLVSSRPADARELSPRVRVALGLCALALAGLALIRLATGPRLPFKG